jgi:hypothetical protein
MSGKKAALILLGIAAALVVVRFVVFAERKDDATLIREALAESILASKEGRPGGVMDKISEQFKLNDQQPGVRQIADIIRKNKPDVQVLKPDPVVNESQGTAQIYSPVKLSLSFLNQNFDTEIPNVTIKFKREDSRQWLIFPAKQWRVTEVTVPPESLPNLPSMGFGFP